MNPILAKRLAGLGVADRLEEIFAHPGSVYFTGLASLDGRQVMVVATDCEPPPQPPDLAASLARAVKALCCAGEKACPVVFLHDTPAPYRSGRTAFQGSGVDLMMGKEGVGRQYFETCRLWGRVPLVCGVFGNMAQAQAFPVAMCDAVVMMKDASLSVARPDAVKAMLGEEVSYQQLGGAHMHSRLTGSCDELAESEDEVFIWIRRYLSYLPPNCAQAPLCRPPCPPDAQAAPIGAIIPGKLNHPFDVRRVIASLVDQGQFLELGRHFAGEAVTGLVRIEGKPAGVVANNPQVKGGVVFPETCRKMTRFIDLCGAFNLPLVFLADAPGFMIGSAAEKAGIVQAGARLFAAIAQSPSPRLCVVLRRAYTAGMYAMAGSGFAPKALYALPGASISVYGPEAIARFINGLDLPAKEKESIRKRMEEDARLESLVDRGFLTGVIEPEKVRQTIADFLQNALPASPRGNS